MVIRYKTRSSIIKTFCPQIFIKIFNTKSWQHKKKSSEQGGNQKKFWFCFCFFLWAQKKSKNVLLKVTLNAVFIRLKILIV